MADITVRIPGKLMLAGEYAVLMRAPALLACVDRFVTAKVTRQEETSSITATGFGNVTAGFKVQRKRLRWDEGVDTARLALVSALLEQFPPSVPISIELDSSAFYDGERKLGLGSSASVAVALGIALAHFSGQERVLEGIAEAHKRFQKGKGSGADVHAVARGGVVIFRHDPKRSSANASHWPQGLLAQPVRCQRSADTTDRIGRFTSWLTSDPAAREMLESAVVSAEQVANCWRSGTPAVIIDAMNDYADRMYQLDEAAQLGYLAGGHRQLLRLAGEAGVFYKPCGAGGGDYGIALTTDNDALLEFREQANNAGYVAEPMSLQDNRPSIVIEPTGIQT